MNATRHLVVSLAAVLAAGSTAALSQGTPAVAPPATGQNQTANAPIYSTQQLDSLLAPIALYPDSLLAQILMASTYPLEVVQAARWSKSNANKGGDAAVNKVDSQPWDPSVKSLVAFPNVLNMMSDQLDWTQNLGDAFLAQQGDVIDSIQRLRHQAQSAGNLKSNAQQTVVAQGQTIIIQPTQPEIIFVPAYNPTIVFGSWAYPSYPPAYYPGVMGWYPGQAVVSGMMFGAGVAMAGAMFGGFNWGNGHGNGSVNVNVNNYRRYDRNFNSNNNNWQHNPQHRGAVAYRDPASRQQFSNRVAGSDARRDSRGYGDAANRSANNAGNAGNIASARQQGTARAATGAGSGAGGTGGGQPVDRAAARDRVQNVDRSAVQDRAQNVDRSAVQNRAQNVDRSAVQSRAQNVDRSAVQNRAQNVDRSAGQNRAQGAARGDAFQGVGSGNGQQQADRGRASAAAANRSGGAAAGGGQRANAGSRASGAGGAGGGGGNRGGGGRGR